MSQIQCGLSEFWPVYSGITFPTPITQQQCKIIVYNKFLKKKKPKKNTKIFFYKKFPPRNTKYFSIKNFLPNKIISIINSP